jgi:hypothetical protein
VRAGQNAARAALSRILTYQNYSFVKSAHRTRLVFFTPLVGTQPAMRLPLSTSIDSIGWGHANAAVPSSADLRDTKRIKTRGKRRSFWRPFVATGK